MVEDLTGNKKEEVQEKVKDVGKTTSKTLKTVAKGLQQLNTKNEQFIYVGPNLPSGRLLRFTVFMGKRPQYIEELLENNPDINKLLVPVTNLKQTLLNIEKTGTSEHQAFQQLLKGVE